MKRTAARRRRPAGPINAGFLLIAIPVAGLLAFGVLGKHDGAGFRAELRYANCSQAHAAGRYDIPRSDPAYASRLDADNDGLACEPMDSR